MSESLLSQEEQRLFDDLISESKSAWETFKKRRFRKYWEGVIDKYPHSAHFIYELIQNADDAKATHASFILYKDQLIFKHNGAKHFNITPSYNEDESKKVGDVNALVSAGDSTKDGVNSIGKFGVGFKSVFQYTNSPAIYDEKFRFKIENYIVPIQLEGDHPLRKDGETLFVIRFKNPEKDYKHILNRLQKLVSPILFLNHLTEVDWHDEGSNRVSIQRYNKKIISRNKYNDVSVQRIITENNQEMLLLSKYIHVCFDNKKTKQKISIAYYVDKNKNSLETKQARKVHCFFQMSLSFGMCFIAHAPFQTIDNRDGILSDNEVNENLTKELAILAADSLEILRDISIKEGVSYLNENIFDIIPWKYLENDIDGNSSSVREDSTYTRVFYDCMLKRIKETPLILATDGKYHYPKDLVISDISISKIISNSQLNELINSDGKAFIKCGTSSSHSKFLRAVLSICVIDNEWISRHITSDFMKKQSEIWVNCFYEYLHGLKKFQIDFYLESPVISANDNNYYQAFDSETKEPIVYLPIDEKSEEIESDEYVYVNKIYLSKHIDLFKEKFSLKKPDTCDYIKKIIIPTYRSALLKNDEQSMLMLLSNLIVSFESYWNENHLRNERDINLLQEIKEEIKLKAIDGYYPSSSLIIIEHADVSEYYSTVSTIHGIDLEYYQKHIRLREGLTSFLGHLGVTRNHPLIIKKSSLMSGSRGGLMDYVVYELEYFDQCKITPNSSKLIWNILHNNLDKTDVYDLFYCHYRYSSASPGTKWKFDGPSKLLQDLCSKKWLFINGEWLKPREVDMDQLHSNGYVPDTRLEKHLEIGVEAELRKKRLEEEEKRRILEESAENAKAINDIFNGDKAEAEEAKRFFDKYKNHESKLDAFLKWEEEHPDENLPYTDLLNNTDFNLSADSNLESLNLESLDFREEPSRVRKTIHYIGCQLYRSYLRKTNRDFTESTSEDDPYDFQQENNFIVVASVEYKTSNEKFAPVYMRSAMHRFMIEHLNSSYHIVRLSLSDLGIDFARIKELYERCADVYTDEELRRDCNKLVSNYWSSKTVEEFEENTPEYQIKIVRI